MHNPGYFHPVDFEVKLGFDQIRTKLENYCLGPLGNKEVGQIHFSSDGQSIRTLLQCVRELKQIFENGETLPLNNYADPSVYFETIRMEESFLEEENFQEIVQAFQSILAIHKLLKSSKNEYQNWFKFTLPVI